MNNKQINELADDAANVAISYIQDKLGQEHGDFAGLYFSGDRWALLMSTLKDYIKAEIQEGKT